MKDLRFDEKDLEFEKKWHFAIWLKLFPLYNKCCKKQLF